MIGVGMRALMQVETSGDTATIILMKMKTEADHFETVTFLEAAVMPDNKKYHAEKRREKKTT